MATNARTRQQESLLFASEALQGVIAAAEPTSEWIRGAHGALRDCALAVETQLQVLRSPTELGGNVARNQPRLLPAMTRLEGSLARLLVDVWEAEVIPPSERLLFVPRLQALADELRAVANDEWNLVYDVQNEPGGIG